jgi:hypothetical protein
MLADVGTCWLVLAPRLDRILATGVTRFNQTGATAVRWSLATVPLQESSEKLKEADAELEKATAASAPVLEQKCERFLVINSVATICAALQKHIEEKALTEEQMLKEMGGKKLDQAKFVDFVGKMPEVLVGSCVRA